MKLIELIMFKEINEPGLRELKTNKMTKISIFIVIFLSFFIINNYFSNLINSCRSGGSKDNFQSTEINNMEFKCEKLAEMNVSEFSMNQSGQINF